MKLVHGNKCPPILQRYCLEATEILSCSECDRCKIDPYVICEHCIILDEEMVKDNVLTLPIDMKYVERRMVAIKI